MSKALVIDGTSLKKIRRDRGLTQVQLAAKSAVALANISLFERGDKGASLATLGKLAQTLEVDPGRLVPYVPQS
jgi:transcriptional regulator with XRE-family HTH domain